MGKVANDERRSDQMVTTAAGDGPPGVPLARVLRSPALAGSTVIAGRAGVGRRVLRINVMEVPDIHPWVRPGELLLTTGYSVREDPSQLVDLLTGLHEREVAALAVKLGRYLDELPAAVLRKADELGFPVIALPAHVSFDDILTEVLTEVLTDRVSRHAGSVVRTEQVHRRLVDLVLGGGGLAAVAEGLSDALDVVVLVTTPDGRTLATAGPPEQVDTVRAGPWLEPTGRLRTEDPVAALGLHPRGDVTLAVATISAGMLDHGRLTAFSLGRSLDDDDLVAVQRAATVCALVVTRDLAVAAVEDKYRADYVRDLLLGRAGPAPEAASHARGFGWDLDRPMVVVVLEPDPQSGDEQRVGAGAAGTDTAAARRPIVERQAAALAGAVRSRDPKAPVVALRAETVALLGLPSDADVPRLVRELVAVVRGDGGGGRKPFGVGVSRVCDGVGGVARGYEQARTAVRVGRQVHGPRAQTHFDDLGVYRLLSLVQDEGELASFAAETLKELATPGVEQEDLRRTLEVLLETNINVAETARRLHFHYNTLRYRIGKLERIVGPFTSEPTLRLDLSLALKVVAMRGLSGRD